MEFIFTHHVSEQRLSLIHISGIAIVPSNGTVVSPINGTIATVMDTQHAVCIQGEDGLELIVHAGLDTCLLYTSGVDIDEMDITDADQVNKVIKEAAPDAVIHCACLLYTSKQHFSHRMKRQLNILR